MGATTLTGAIGNAWYFLGQVVFSWVPALVVSVTGTPPATSPTVPVSPPIPGPVTYPDLVNYLQTAAAPEAYAHFIHDWTIFVVLSLIASILLGALIAYCIVRIREVRAHEEARFEAMGHTVAAHDIPRTHLRWNKVVEEASSPDDSKWRLAILEADIMLNELLDVLGYRGETMGDKMKQVDRSNFRTIDLAWEAHTVRNKVAHQGSSLSLTQREVRRVIGLYEQVFREFKFVE